MVDCDVIYIYRILLMAYNGLDLNSVPRELCPIVCIRTFIHTKMSWSL
jgi:hypothetical protein